MSLIIATLLLSTAPSLAPQAPPVRFSTGPFAGMPGAFTVAPGLENATTKLNPTQIYAKRGGFAGPPVALNNLNIGHVVDFSPTARFGLPGSYSLNKLPQEGAVSLGMDWINTDDEGVITTPPLNWAASVFSVHPFNKSSAATDVIGMENFNDNGAQADLFCYLLPLSNHPDFPIGISRAADSDEIGITFTQNSIDKASIRGVDMTQAAYEMGIPLPLLFKDPDYYFSLEPGSVHRVPSSWFKDTVRNETLPSAASILLMSWNSITKTWSTPTLFMSFRDLHNIDDVPVTQDDEIDGLSVDKVRHCLMFSLKRKTATSDEAQMAIVLLSTNNDKKRVGSKTRRYRLPGGAGRIWGRGRPDIKGVCNQDPKNPVFQFLMGTPLPSTAPPAGPAGPLAPPSASGVALTPAVYRVAATTANGTIESIESRLIGWPTTNTNVQQYASLFVTFNGVGVTHLGTQARVGGDLLSPVYAQMTAPIVLTTSTLDVYAEFTWIAHDGTNVLGTTKPLRIKLAHKP